MNLLKNFLIKELKIRSHVDQIVAYYYEKFGLDPIKEDLGFHFISLIYRANCAQNKKKDEEFLTHLGICFSIGIALTDDIIDDDLTAVWAGVPYPCILNIACQFLFFFPYKLIIFGKSISPKTKIKLTKIISKFYLKISSGEYQQMTNSLNNFKNLTLNEIFIAMQLKTGEWHALEAAVALVFANKVAAKNNRYITFAKEFGVLRQIHNDIHDTFKAEKSQDLLTGVANFPVSVYMLSLNDTEKKLFLKKLKSCQKTKASTEKLSKEIMTEDLLSYCILILNVQRYKLKLMIQELNLSKSLHSEFVWLINV